MNKNDHYNDVKTGIRTIISGIRAADQSLEQEGINGVEEAMARILAKIADPPTRDEITQAVIKGMVTWDDAIVADTALIHAITSRLVVLLDGDKGFLENVPMMQIDAVVDLMRMIDTYANGIDKETCKADDETTASRRDSIQHALARLVALGAAEDGIPEPVDCHGARVRPGVDSVRSTAQRTLHSDKIKYMDNRPKRGWDWVAVFRKDGELPTVHPLAECELCEGTPVPSDLWKVIEDAAIKAGIGSGDHLIDTIEAKVLEHQADQEG